MYIASENNTALLVKFNHKACILGQSAAECFVTSEEIQIGVSLYMYKFDYILHHSIVHN